MPAEVTGALRVSPEDAILIGAAGGRCAVPVDSARPVDWAAALSGARWHRLVPLLWHRVRHGAAGVEVPDAVLAAARDEARRTTARSLNLQFELDRALALFEREGIPALLLKGAALVEAGVYADPGLRVMSDIDLLVPRPQLVTAHHLMSRELGYAVRGEGMGAVEDPQMQERYQHLHQLVGRGGAVIVELHHRLFVDRPDEDVGGVWDRARPVARTPARMLPAPEDLLLHVAVHFGTDRVSNRDSALGQLADLVRIVERWPIDWDAVRERAAAARVSDRLFLALYSAEVLMGDVVEPDVLAALQPASFTAELGLAFVHRRVLAQGPALPLGQLQVGGLRRIFPGRGALERYVRIGEPQPSLTRLRIRRLVALARLVTAAPRPGQLREDVRLSRWMADLLG